MADGPARALLLDEPIVPESDRSEVDVPVPVGTLLAGRYSVETVLAQGGMGVVWLGRHVELDQPVAIKFLRRALSGKEAVVQRFLNEARAAAALRSEHVVRVIDVGQLDSGRPYLVMEHLEGVDLDALVEKDGPLDVEKALGYALQVCEALADAHSAGIVHRDIKPENLFLPQVGSAKPMVKVVDFGLAKRLDASASKVVTGPQENMGSPCYMSPEQIGSPRDVDERTDIWSLGVVLYRLLTGALPFDGDSVTEVCSRVLNAPPAPLFQVRPGLDPQLDAVVQRELSDALHRYLAAAVSATQPASVVPQSLRLLAPPKRPQPVDEPVREPPRARRLRLPPLGRLSVRSVGIALVVAVSAYVTHRSGLRPHHLTDGWLTAWSLRVDSDTVERSADPPLFSPALGESGDLAQALGGQGMARAERERRRVRRTSRAPFSAAAAAPRDPRGSDDPSLELTPEEIERRKMAYQEYLASHGYQPLRDVLQRMRSEGSASDSNGGRIAPSKPGSEGDPSRR